jgi:hypothetical protein
VQVKIKWQTGNKAGNKANVEANKITQPRRKQEKYFML